MLYLSSSPSRATVNRKSFITDLFLCVHADRDKCECLVFLMQLELTATNTHTLPE